MHFTDLRIYQIALRLSKEIDVLIRQIPYFWNIPEGQQILESSSSSPANIAEGFAKRVYPREFIKFLNNALGSSDESQHHINALHEKDHISQKDFEYFSNQFKNLSIKILNTIRSTAKNNGINLIKGRFPA